MRILTETILLAEDDPDDVFLTQRALDQSRLANPLQLFGMYAGRLRYWLITSDMPGGDLHT